MRAYIPAVGVGVFITLITCEALSAVELLADLPLPYRTTRDAMEPIRLLCDGGNPWPLLLM